MPMSYVVSAKKSTVVSSVQVGNFTSTDNLNLLVNRGNRIEVKLVTPEGLKNVTEIPIYGRISVMKLFRPKSSDRDYLVVFTEKCHLAILSYSNESVITEAAGSIADRVGRPSSHGTVLTIHKSGLIAVRIYEGTLKIVQWESEKDLKHFNVRFDCINVIDLTFMDTDNTDEVRLAYIFQNKQGRHLRLVDLNIDDKEFESFASQDNIEADSSFVIPIPCPTGGIVVLGNDTILYKNNDAKDPIIPSASPLVSRTSFTCFSAIDKSGERFLLADDKGRLLMLLLNIDNNIDGSSIVVDLRVEYLGVTSIANDLVYLDNGVVYVASRLGDSQLIRLADAPLPDGTFVEILETYTNIGPVRDMIFVDSEGQPQLVTCSGAFKEGSLRVIRNGIGIEEMASADLPGVSGLFPIKLRSDFDNYIVVSMKDETHILQISGEELEDVQLLDVDLKSPTLYAGSLFDRKACGILLQITSNEIRLMAEGCETMIWKPDNDMRIAKVSVNEKNGQIVVAARDTLYYLKCNYDELSSSLGVQLVTKTTFEHEISCMDFSNEGDNADKEATFGVICMWESNQLKIISLPDLKTVNSSTVLTNTVARSVVAACIEDVHYILVALGDGTLFYYNFNITDGTLGASKKSIIGTRPPSIHRVRSKNSQHLFVCSDRPVIIFSINKKLAFSNVNVKFVNSVCSLQSESYNDCLVLSDGEGIVFGRVDDIQKIHVRTIPIGESVRRITHQHSTATFGILSSRKNDSENDRYPIASKTALSFSSSKPKSQRTDLSLEKYGVEVSTFMVLDQNTFKVLHCHELGQFESAMSIISAKLGDDPKEYYIVGAATIYPDETETKMGRILVFEIDDNDKSKLKLVYEKDIRGCPFDMSVYNSKLVVGVNSSIRLFEWTNDFQLRLESSHFNNITVLSVKTMGDHILVGDLMRSISILTYRSMEGTFEDVARDWNNMWTTSCDFITAERILGSEIQNNLFSCSIRKLRDDDEARLYLDPYANFYLGDMVNVMKKCNLVNQQDDSAITYSQPIMFGTVDGSIGLVVDFDDKWMAYLKAIEKIVAESSKNCLNIDHSTYRQLSIPHRNDPNTFIDGDLIETVLDMDREKALSLFQKLNDLLPADNDLPRDPVEVLKIVEDLSRIH